MLITERTNTMNKSKLPQVHTLKRGKKYSYYFEGIPVDGKRTRITGSGFSSEADAFAEGELKRNQYYGISDESSSEEDTLMSFQDFVKKEWLPKRKKLKKWSLETTRYYNKLFDNHIFPQIGEYPVSSLTTEILQDMIDSIYYFENRSLNTVSHIHSLMLNVMEYATNHKYNNRFFKNEFAVPKADFDIENLSPHRTSIPSDALDRIFARFPEGSPAFLIMAICLFTGARVGEAAALAVEDCDFDNNTITIQRQFPDNMYGYTKLPKYNSIRTVPMCSTLKGLLLNAVEERNKNQDKKKTKNSYLHTYFTKVPHSIEFKNTQSLHSMSYEKGDFELHFLCVNQRGKPHTPHVMKHASRIIHGFKCDHKHKNVENPLYAEFKTHCLRHTFATFLHTQSIDPISISAVLGHKRTAIEGASKTTTTYIHISDEKMKEIEKVIDNIYKFKDGVLKNAIPKDGE